MSTQINFTKDWKQIVVGDLMPNESFQLVYDNIRLPDIRDTYNGLPAWSILGYIRVITETTEECYYKALEYSDNSELMYQTYDIPADAEEISMWFVNTGNSGIVKYDSNYSENYNFRFTRKDLQVSRATISTSWPTPYSGLYIDISTSLSVDKAQACCKIITSGQEVLYDNFDFSVRELHDSKKDCYLYVYIPYNASVIFDILYWVNGRQYLDDNGGKSYTTPINN